MPANDTPIYIFPEPIGGAIVDGDLVPSILFLAAFFCLVVLNIFKFTSKSRRTITTLPSLTVSLEKCIVMSQRIVMVVRQRWRESFGITEYHQAAFGAGTPLLFQERVYILISLAVFASRDNVPFVEWWKDAKTDRNLLEKKQEERMWARNYGAWIDRGFAVVIGTQYASPPFLALSSRSKGMTSWVLPFRLVSNILELFVGSFVILYINQIQRRLPNVSPQPLRRLKLASILLLVSALYRCTVSYRTTSTIDYLASPSSIPPKVGLYLFQLLPELLSMTVISLTNFRSSCDTGPWGDVSRERIEKGKHTDWKWFRLLFIGPFGALLEFIKMAVRRRVDTVESEEKEEEQATTTLAGTEIEMQSGKSSLRSGKESVYSGYSGTTKRSWWGSETIALDVTTPSSSSLITDVSVWTPRSLPAFSWKD